MCSILCALSYVLYLMCSISCALSNLTDFVYPSRSKKYKWKQVCSCISNYKLLTDCQSRDKYDGAMVVFLTIAYRQSRDKYNGIFLDLEQGRLKSINQVLACFDITKVSDISMVIFYFCQNI